MKNFRKIESKELQDNAIKLIGQDWMLIGAGTPERSNAMTASWGSLGFYSNQPIVTIFVRPERYTYQFIESSTHFTLTVLDAERKDAHMIFGKMSGRDCDKAALAGVTPIFTELGNPTFEEGRVVIECRKIFSQTMPQGAFVDQDIYNRWYGAGHGGDHVMYMGVIENCWVKFSSQVE
ncbi:MAG: flavin reductase family protein [Rikenellaceae bacterium]